MDLSENNSLCLLIFLLSYSDTTSKQASEECFGLLNALKEYPGMVGVSWIFQGALWRQYPISLFFIHQLLA